jgi:hypothetical protein
LEGRARATHRPCAAERTPFHLGRTLVTSPADSARRRVLCLRSLSGHELAPAVYRHVRAARRRVPADALELDGRLSTGIVAFEHI